MATYSSILAWRIPGTEETGCYSPLGPRELETTEATEHTCRHRDTMMKPVAIAVPILKCTMLWHKCILNAVQLSVLSSFRNFSLPQMETLCLISVCSVASVCPTLCDPMDHSLPGSPVHGILQAKYWSRLPCPPPGDLPDPGIESMSLISPTLAGRFFTTSATWEAQILGIC